MTTEEKLDFIISKLDKIDIIEKNIKALQEDVDEFKSDIKEIKRKQMKNVAELKAMDDLIFNEVERVHEIMLRRTDELSKKIG